MSVRDRTKLPVPAFIQSHFEKDSGSVTPNRLTPTERQAGPGAPLGAADSSLASLNLALSDPVTKALRQVYDDVAREPLPDDLAQMIAQIDDAIAAAEQKR